MEFLLDKNDFEGVAIALEALRKDFTRVFGECDARIFAGTVGKTDFSIDTSEIRGKRESYIIEETPNGTVIAGSDKRGTIYGIYRLSEIIGVSPWVWWADSVPTRREKFELPANFRIVQGEPSVKYRGFFLNDEAPSLSGWVGKKFGKLLNEAASPGYDSEFYAHVFELLLRLKGNYFWPVMWNNSFHTDDAENSALADRMGIVMGTSHHEHMTCADKEWNWANLGDWNYHTNKERIYKFWNSGTEARKNFESIITLGMRGQADSAILGADATLRDNIALLQGVIDDQRKIVRDVYGAENAAPQMIALYKEVEDFYYGDGTDDAAGKLHVPEDVTLMLCDDNFGNLRTLPTDEMLKRSGGFGMYYHFDYRGEPISYEWINQTPLAKVWDNMTAAYDAGIKEIWIVNVGDLKPMEFPLEYFMNLAYDFEKWSVPNRTEEFTRAFAAREFGEEFADDVASLLTGYTKILGARKAEVVHPETFSPETFGEAERVLSGFAALVAKAEAVFDKLADEKKSTFFQLVLYPVRAAYNVYRCNICAAKGDADGAKAAYDANTADTEYFNTGISGGKWDGIMRQNHMCYTEWDSAVIQPVPNKMPEIAAVGAASVTMAGGGAPKNYVSINPSKFSAKVAGGGAEFIVIEGYGRDIDSVKVLPNGAAFAVGGDAPMLEYKFELVASGEYAANFFLAPTNPPKNPELTPLSEQMRFSVQIDGGERQTVHGLPEGEFTPGHGNNWCFGVLDNARIIHFPLGSLAAGVHSLKIFAIDPAVVYQKIVIAPASEKPREINYAPRTTHFMGAYFGPPVDSQ